VGNGIFAPARSSPALAGNQLQQTQGQARLRRWSPARCALQSGRNVWRTIASPTEVRNILQSTGDTINDGDNEDDAVFVDSNGNGQVDSGEFQSLKNTAELSALNVYKA